MIVALTNKLGRYTLRLVIFDKPYLRDDQKQLFNFLVSFGQLFYLILMYFYIGSLNKLRYFLGSLKV